MDKTEQSSCHPDNFEFAEDMLGTEIRVRLQGGPFGSAQDVRKILYDALDLWREKHNNV